MEGGSNRLLTAVVCAGAAFVAVLYLIKSRTKHRQEPPALLKQDCVEQPGLGATHEEHRFHLAMVNSHITQVHTMREWCDASLGVKFHISPAVLRPLLEERQYPVVHVKLAVVNKQDVISVVIEESPEVASVDEYKDICLARLELCAKVLTCDSMWGWGAGVRVLSYQFANERDHTVTVLAAVQQVSGRFVTVQHQTVGDRCADNARSLLSDIVRSVRPVQHSGTPSSLYCTEPRNGVGMSLDLSLTFVSDDTPTDGDVPRDSNSFQFARFTRHDGLMVTAQYECFSPKKYSIRDVMLEVMRQARLRYALRKKLVTRDKGRPVAKDEMPVTIMAQREVVVADDEAVQRPAECIFFGADCPVDGLGDGEAGGASALLCVYLYNVLTEYVSVSFFLPKTGNSSLESFLELCSRIGDSLTTGNHYGQETTVVYCNRRFCHPFRIRLASHWTVWEPPLGDPLCVVAAQGLSLHEVEVRVMPCDVRDANDAQDFKLHCEQLVYQLPGRVSIRSSRMHLLRRGSAVVEIVFSETETDGGQDCGSNPFSRCSCPRPSRGSNPVTPREAAPLRIVVVVCTNEGFAFVLHIAATAYDWQEAQRVVDQVAAELSLAQD